MTTRELELGTPKSFNDGILMPVVSPDRHQGLSDLDTSDGSLGFAKGASHSGLEPIGTSARQHFVDTQDMERMDTDPDVELILSGVLDHVLKLKKSKNKNLFLNGKKLHFERRVQKKIRVFETFTKVLRSKRKSSKRKI